MPYTPTVAIGLGAAGIRMVEAINDVFEEEAQTGEYMPFAIDTKEDEMEEFLPRYESKYKLNLREPDSYEEGSTPRQYLQDDDTLAVEGGAQKERPVARYYMDSQNFKRTNNKLTKRLEEFDNEVRQDTVDIWLCSSLGGGTGSGLLPSVASLVEFIVTNELNTTTGFRIRGIGSFPEIGEFDNTVFGGDARHVINSYLAMRELQGLLDGKNRTLSDPSIPFGSNPDRLRDNNLHPESPLASYFLLPYDEERDSSGYRRVMNRVVAYLVYYYAMVEASEDFPQNVDPSRKDEVYMIDARELAFPREGVEKYLAKERDRINLETTISDLESQLDSFRDDEAYLNEVIALSSGSTPDPESAVNPYWIENELHQNEEGVGVDQFEIERITENTLTTRAQDAAEFICSEQEELQTLFGLDAVDDAVLGAALADPEVDETDGDDDEASLYDRLGGFDARTVVEYFYYDQLHARLVPQLHTAEQTFKSELSDAWAEFQDDFQDRYPTEYQTWSDVDDPSRRWEKGLRRYLNEERRRLKREIDDRYILTGGLEDELERKKEVKSDVASAYARVEELSDKVQTVRQERDRLDRELESHRSRLESAIRRVDRDIEQKERQLVALEERIEEEAAALQSFDHGRFASMALGTVETLSEETLVDIEDAAIGDLVPQYVKRDELRQELNDLILDLKDPSDYERNLQGSNRPASVLTYLLSDDNVDDDVIDWHDLLTELGNDAPFDQVAGMSKRVDIEASLVVRLLGIHTNVQFEHIPWWNTMHEAFLSDEAFVSELLGSTEERNQYLDDHARFAYPELVPEASVDAQSQHTVSVDDD